jgi:hypothetical protein
MKRIFSSIIAVIVLSLPVLAQDSFRISGTFTNTEFSDVLTSNYTQGLAVEFDGSILQREVFRLGGVFQYSRLNFRGISKIDTYSAGPQLSVGLLKNLVRPYGRALFGVGTTYNSDSTFTTTYGVGVDINLGRVFIRPFGLDFVKAEGDPTVAQKFSVGGGFRF